MTKKSIWTLPSLAIVFAALLAMIVLGTSQLRAQNAFGALVGTVTDSSGAVVPGATVTLTNLGTNEKKVMQSETSGSYRFVNLPPTQYKIEVQKTGYKNIIQSPITIQVDATGRLDVALQVGNAATETVEVTTQAPLLQTESGTLGSQVEGKTVEEMPLNGRNVMNLITLVPGVVPQGASMGNTTMNQGTHTNNAGWGNFQIGGSISGQGSFFLDGAPLSTAFGHDVAFIPTQDAIQEFKVGTNSVSAEFGRFAGGVVEMATKGGSNNFHGTAYEYLRNTVLNANTYGASSKQKWLQNQYGFAVGGPVLKNKAFFFFSWEKFASRTANLDTGNVPDAGMVAASNPSVPGNITGNAANLPAAQQTLGCLAAGNYNITTNRTTIPTACLDATAQVVKNYFAAATNSNAVGSPAGNYSYLVPLGDNNQQFNTRGDINLGKQSILLRYSHLGTNDMPSVDMQNHGGFKTGGSISVYPTTQAVIGDTITINPTTIADVRLSFTRAYSNDGPPSAGANLTALGFSSNWGAINAQQNIPLLPSFGWSGGYNLWQFRGFEIVDNRFADNYAVSYSVTKIKGAHTLKFGGENDLFDVNAVPQFNPGSVNIDNNNYAKDEWANFLLGNMTSFSFSKAIRTSSYYYYAGFYASDTWNATRKLTVTAGLRWELPGAIAERQDRGTVLLPNATGTANGSSVKGILALLNSTAYAHRGDSLPAHGLFSPRLGVAYRLNNNTVLRAGYALAYLPIDIAQSALPSYGPVDLATTGTPSYNTNYTVSNPLGVGSASPVAITQPYGKSNPNFLNSYANASPLQSVSSPVPYSSYGYMQQWNVTVGQQFKGEQSVEVGYAGAIGIHLPSEGSWNLNELPYALAQQLAAGTITGAQAQAQTTYPGYLSFSNSNPFNSTMTYNALQARYQKRIGTGTISSGYTWSKSIGDTDTVAAYLNNGNIGNVQDYNNQKGERSLLSYSIAQRWVTSYIVNLPFGKGQKFLNSVNGVTDRIIGGWSLNGITTLQTGQPLTLNVTGRGPGNTYAAQWGAGTIRPNYAAGCAKKITGSAQSRLKEWFNTSCFSTPSAYAFGNEPRADSTLRAAGVANWDFTAQKTTKVVEGTSLAFRVEFFNVFNRRQFSNPNMSTSSGAGFGTINSQQNNPRQIQASLRLNF